MTEGVPLNDPCTDSSDCAANVPNSRCSGIGANKICHCDFGYEENGGNCIGMCLLLYLPSMKANFTAAEYRHHYLIKLLLKILCMCIN